MRGYKFTLPDQTVLDPVAADHHRPLSGTEVSPLGKRLNQGKIGSPGPIFRFLAGPSRLLQQEFLPGPATDDAPDLVAVCCTLIRCYERPFDLL